MLRAIRSSRVATLSALVALAATVSASLGTLLHTEDDDVLCQLTFVRHDDSAHRLTASGRSMPRPEHCAICHWLQSLRTVQGTVRLCAPSSVPHLVAVASGLEPVSAIRSHQPARAPPLV